MVDDEYDEAWQPRERPPCPPCLGPPLPAHMQPRPEGPEAEADSHSYTSNTTTTTSSSSSRVEGERETERDRESMGGLGSNSNSNSNSDKDSDKDKLVRRHRIESSQYLDVALKAYWRGDMIRAFSCACNAHYINKKGSSTSDGGSKGSSSSSSGMDTSSAAREGARRARAVGGSGAAMAIMHSVTYGKHEAAIGLLKANAAQMSSGKGSNSNLNERDRVLESDARKRRLATPAENAKLDLGAEMRSIATFLDTVERQHSVKVTPPRVRDCQRIDCSYIEI